MAIRLTSSGLEGLTYVSNSSTSSPSVGGVVTRIQSSAVGASDVYLPSSGNYILCNPGASSGVGSYSGGTTIGNTYFAIRMS